MVINSKFLIPLSLVFSLLIYMAPSYARVTNPIATTDLHVSASIGPEHFLSGGKVSVKNAMGQLVGQGITNSRGVVLLHLPSSKLQFLPLRVTTKSGKIFNKTGDSSNGLPFKGHLSAEIIDPIDTYSIIYLDLISTVASALAPSGKSYVMATTNTKKALGVNLVRYLPFLRYPNNYIQWTQLENAINEAGGYDRFVTKLAFSIKKNKPQNWLNKPKNSTPTTPKIYSAGVITPQAAPAATSVCTPPTGNASTTTSSTNASTTIIEDFGVIAMEGLLQVTGVPSSVVGGLAGMLLSGGSSPATPITTTMLSDVEDQLACISTQITYLKTQADRAALNASLATAFACQTNLETQWNSYQAYVEGATDGTAPMNSSNNSFVGAVQKWDMTGGVGGTTGCANEIDAMLFGNSTTLATGAWQALNTYFQDIYPWYANSQTQELQSFLAYYGTLEYYQEALTNEYYNWNGYTQQATIDAGNVSESSTLCQSASTSQTTFCFYQNNIINAYPSDLYSDEIAIPSNGLAVIPYPTSEALNLASPYSGVSGINANYFGEDWVSGIGVNCSNYAVCNGKWQYGNVGKYSQPAAPNSAIDNISLTDYFSQATLEANKTLIGIGPYGGIVYSPSLSPTGSAIETYTAPQVPHSEVISSTQLPNLNSQSNGQSALTVFYNAINQANPTSPLWSGLSASNVAYFTADNSVTVTDQPSVLEKYVYDVGDVKGTCATDESAGMINGQVCNQLQVQMAAYLNGSSPILQNCEEDECVNAGNPSATYPIMAQLLGRTWWAGAASATTYTRTAPPTE